MSNTLNVTVIQMDEVTRLYQTSRPLNRNLHNFAIAKKVLSAMQEDGQIVAFEEFGESVMEIRVRRPQAWEHYEDQILETLILGTASVDDKAYVYDRGNDTPRQAGEVSVDDDEKLHYTVVDLTVAA